jgi:hypothetical protein
MMLNLTPFAWAHTILSLVALVAGVVVVADLIVARVRSGWTVVFFVTAVATDLTGFLFRGVAFGPAHWIGVISLAALIPALVALWIFHLAGVWRWIYVGGTVIGTYLLLFVTIVQAFEKVLALAALAPTQTEPPFAIAQLVGFVVFVALALSAVIRFRPPAKPATHP